MSTESIIAAVNPAQLAACYPLMRQLRPHLASAEEFAARVQRQQNEAGYRLFALWPGEKEGDGAPLALAGYRQLDNLMHGRHCYVDDLVTDELRRGHGHGRLLLDHIAQQAISDGCAKLLLDTPMANALGHRFYYRAGLLATALRFTWVLPQG